MIIQKIMVRHDLTNDVDGTERLYVLAPWPKRTTFIGGTIDQPDRRYVCRSCDTVTLRCDNGTADYKLANYDYASDVYEASLIDGVWVAPP